jgi:hypothetical protein
MKAHLDGRAVVGTTIAYLAGRTMTKAILHVCNESKDAHVCKRVHSLNTARTPFNVLVRHLSEISQGGVWLTPFRGIIPRMPGLPPMRVVLLSEKLDVVECMAELPEEGISDVDSRVASALILPAITVETANIQAGDRIRLCDTLTRFEWDWRNEEARAKGRICHCFAEETEQASRNAQIEAAISAVSAEQEQENTGAEPAKRKTLRERISLWLTGYKEEPERRETRRSRFPKLVAYYWTGGMPKAFKLGDIGPAGFYLLTSDRWSLGTRMIVTFQRTDCDVDSADSTITMPSTVIRTGQDGVGFAFVSSAAVDRKSGEIVAADGQSRERLNRFLVQAISQIQQQSASSR